MELTKGQFAVFEEIGRKEGYLEASWSNKHNAFVTLGDDGQKYYTTTVIEKPARKKSTEKKKFAPSDTVCTQEIFPCGETEKAYIIATAYGKLKGGVPSQTHYSYVAKSICFIDENKRVFAPMWADIN